MSWKWLLNLLIPFFSGMINMLTPEIKSMLQSFIKDLYKKSVETPNVMDDLFVGLLAQILSVEIDK